MQLQRSNRELWAALGAIVVITSVYVPLASNSPPRSSSLFGYILGITGFLLMLATETLYSLRKRSRGIAWGRTSTWLSVHIFMGIVGPYMVLLHSSWKFNGLAGVVLLLAVIVSLSGFVGRYIYTAVPRTASGIVLEADELQQMIMEADEELQAWETARPEAAQSIAERLAALPSEPTNDLMAIFGRALLRWNYRRHWAREINRLDKVERAQAAQLKELLDRERRLKRQARSLAVARKMLSAWHTIHVPLGVALFITAFAHVAAVLSLVTFGR